MTSSSTPVALVRLVSSIAVSALAVTPVGCAHVGQLKEAASADLKCPQSRVVVLNSGRTRDVEACGQRATYHYEDGDWRMVARSGLVPVPGPQPVARFSPPPSSAASPQPAPVMSPTGTPSQPPPSSPPPPAPGSKSL
jgi:hypothetical protein